MSLRIMAPIMNLPLENGRQEVIPCRLVARRILDFERYLKKGCPGADASKARRIKQNLDKMGKDILSKIANTSVKLTGIAEHYAQGSKVGCGGAESVSLHTGAN